MGHYGIVFNSNRELLRNYHAEKRFELHHYTNAGEIDGTRLGLA